ncbi:diacylglycerol kinase 5-like [Gossypium australe]|uniref:Diacylglycerol kinase 5-like n=1 Tax=Gossypium australe TaxID=47621 RepID=A0A5B6X495_9ROSI|nr:diacylglycerol kinase 5-like [Gossypium australe]
MESFDPQEGYHTFRGGFWNYFSMGRFPCMSLYALDLGVGHGFFMKSEEWEQIGLDHCSCTTTKRLIPAKLVDIWITIVRFNMKEQIPLLSPSSYLVNSSLF